jgi:uncharacterized membrane protein YccC
VLPQSVLPLVKCRLDQWFRDTCVWSAAVLRRSRKNGSQASLLLARDAVAFDALVTPLQYEMSGADRSAETMATLRQHMLMFLPFVAAIADRLETLEKALPPKVGQRLDDIAAWLMSGTIDPTPADQLRRSVASLAPVLGHRPQWNDLVVASLVARLTDFIDLRQDARVLRRHVVDGTPVRENLAFRYTAKARTIRHRDHGLAVLSAIAAFLAVILAAAFWIATGWADGASAPMLAAVGCSFFAAQDDPAPQIMDLAKAAVIGAIGAAGYLFIVLPVATSFEMLALALAPSMILCGLLMTQPRTAILGLGIGVVGFTLLALQDRYTGDFAAFANGAIAAVAGVWIAAMVTRLVRSVGGAWSARRLRRINREELAEVAIHEVSGDGLELAALMLDRVGLIAPRLSALPAEDAEWTAELLTEVRIGIDLVELRRVRRSLSPQATAEVDRILSALGDYFRSDAAHAPGKLLAPIDATLDAVAAHEEGSVRNRALLGLTDLRRGLFPHAPPYRPGGSTTLEPGLAA